MEAEKKFRAMGSDIHLIINGKKKYCDFAEKRIIELENLWSRFKTTSEVSKINSSNGHMVNVSEETLELLRNSYEGYIVSEHMFDPTILGDMLTAGYSYSFDENKFVSVKNHFEHGMNSLFISGNQIMFNRNVGFDPGGIGKGLAGDIIARELIDQGVTGACINIGGDIRVFGMPENDITWTLSVDSPNIESDVIVAISSGAIATSTTLLRKWEIDGEKKSHIIDPVTKMPLNKKLCQVTVIASYGWQAEVLAKATLVSSNKNFFDLVERFNAAACAYDKKGNKYLSSNWNKFVVKSEVA